jgi:uncharacterized RDD family membrane protein YckC
MGSKAAAVVNAGTAPRKEVVIGFDPVKLKAPFLLRCGAAIIDYLLIILVPVCGILLARFLGNDGTRLVNSEINNFAWLLAILVGVCDLILLPAVSGQTVGKMVTGLRVVELSGERANVGAILLRQIVGYSLTLLTGGFGLFLSVFSSNGRALHDLISGTVVVYGDSRIRS